MFNKDDVLYACTVYFKDESIRDFLMDYREICDKLVEIDYFDYEVSIWDDFVKKYSKSFFCKFVNKSDLRKLLYRYKVKYNGLPVDLMTDFEYNVLVFKHLYKDIEERKLPENFYTLLSLDLVLKEEDLELIQNNPKDYTIVIDDAVCVRNNLIYLGLTTAYQQDNGIIYNNPFRYLGVAKKDVDLFGVEVAKLDFEEYEFYKSDSSYHFAYLSKNE